MNMQPKRLVLSRKGFDSASGGYPSPIFPDGTIFSLPIPSDDNVRFGELQHGDVDIGVLVADLTNGRYGPGSRAHFDPDLNFESHRGRRSRLSWEDWRGMLGQAGAAETHLANQGVGGGDLFLFFGLYRQVERTVSGWRFVPSAPQQHVLWGWLQIEKKYRTGDLGDGDLPQELAWARHHPHLYHRYGGNNTVYMATETLDLVSAGPRTPLPGWGVFPKLASQLVLTDPDGAGVSDWRLPRWFYPSSGKSPLTYHTNRENWRRDSNHAYTRSVGRGQEFVLNLDGYSEAMEWLYDLISELGEHVAHPARWPTR